MNFRIADTFTASLARLTGDEQKAAKTTAFDLQLDPAHPGFSFHKLDKARDKNFWSVRASRDIRLIVHRTAESLLLAYVGHHDDAYRWAERRRLETHPTTGAAQWVETRERVEEAASVRAPVKAPAPAEAPDHPSAHERAPAPTTASVPAKIKAPPLAGQRDADLLSWGVPVEWLDEVRRADEDRLLELAERLPAEAAEALLVLAVGRTPEARPVAPLDADPFEHPDAQRRFRTIDDQDALQQALDWPWDRWTVFLHPMQRQWVERAQSGPARVTGSAGTGKTVVALHRAVFLARANPEARVLLTTFSEPRRLLGPEVSDVDGNVEERAGTVSVFNGPAPCIGLFADDDSEARACASWLAACRADGFAVEELAVFVRANSELPRAVAACTAVGLPSNVMDERVDAETGAVSIGTMHLAKGLEFKAVAVLACDEDSLPSPERMAQTTDESELREVHETERMLLYVACTRARDRLWVSGVRPGSEFLEDLLDPRA